MSNKHVILIGFKHVGKSVIGQQLGLKMDKPFIDLDRQIEQLFKESCKQSLSARQVMESRGEAFFRELEHQALEKTLGTNPSVIALGGGCPVDLKNQDLLKSHLLIHIKASRDKVFERIMVSGQPAFFSSTEDPYHSFKKLWQEREKIYQSIANFSIDNEGSVEEAVLQIVKILSDHPYHLASSGVLSE